jgi:hypothetical protein
MADSAVAFAARTGHRKHEERKRGLGGVSLAFGKNKEKWENQRCQNR